MTSVQNLQPRLSGNNWLLLLLLLAFTTTTSCELFKKLEPTTPTTNTGSGNDEELDPIEGRRVFDPVTGTYVIIPPGPTEPMDTVYWKTSNGLSSPITSVNVPIQNGSATGGAPTEVDQYGSEYFDQYQVSVLLPFMADRVSSTSTAINNRLSQWSLNFYGGLKMAFEDLGREGKKFQLNVFDTKGTPANLQYLLRSKQAIGQSHLLIGPYLKDNVSLTANFAKERRMAMASPRSAAVGLSADNEYYLQLNPSLAAHCEAIATYVLQRHQPENVFLVGRPTKGEVERFAYFKTVWEQMYGQQVGDQRPMTEFVVNDNTPDLNETDIQALLEDKESAVFIIPSYNDESFVYALLRKIELARTTLGIQNVVVFGLPGWMEFQRIDFDYYEKLNVHTSSASYLDPLSPEVQLFRQRYYDTYGAIPGEEAIKGYDMGSYLGRMLHEYGTRFQFALEGEPASLLHTSFAFKPLYPPMQDDRMGELRQAIQQFENRYVHILQFKDYYFQPAR